MDAKRFGAFISERRKEHHMTQADLAGKVGVTDGFLDISHSANVTYR